MDIGFLNWFHQLPKEKQNEILLQWQEVMMWRGNRGIIPVVNCRVRDEVTKAAGLCSQHGFPISEYT